MHYVIEVLSNYKKEVENVKKTKDNELKIKLALHELTIAIDLLTKTIELWHLDDDSKEGLTEEHSKEVGTNQKEGETNVITSPEVE